MVTIALDKKTEKKITSFVYAKPRSIQEIAFLLQKNWRTADRYIAKIIEESGHLQCRTFREGSRGALKVVYYQNLEKIASTDFQERLLKQIIRGKKKEDFSPFDIYQYVDEKKRDAFLEVQKEEYTDVEQDVISLFNSAQKSIFIFSGNLSWANVYQGKTKVIDVLREIAKKRIPIKILVRVDLASITNLKKVMRINEELGREAIEIRHAEQPLRCVVIDHKQVRFKEVKNPMAYKKGELDDKMCVFYNVYDEEWVEWIQKVFFSMYRGAMDASTRLKSLQSIQKINLVGGTMPLIKE